MAIQKLAKTVAAAAAVGAGAYAAYDIARALSVKAIPDLPEQDEGAGLVHELLAYLENPQRRAADNVVIDDAYIVNALLPAKKYIDGRYDCQDFRMQSLLRLQYSHGSTIRSLSPTGAQMLADIFINAKYWMTEPGEDSLCYWSENHQLLYAVAEYLAGQMWPDRVFTNDGATGLVHMQRGRERIDYWLRHRFRYGYSEYNSSNYYLYNVGPAANFIQFAAPQDAALVQRTRQALDLLLLDVAMHMYRYTFTAPTGRAYVDNMVGASGDRVRKLTDYLWQRNDNHKTETHQMLVNFYAMMNAKDANGNAFYTVPPVILEIGKEEGEQVMRSSHSMNTAELPAAGYVGHADNQIMRQLSMEAFTNEEVIENTVSYLKAQTMFSNKFVNYFKITDLTLIRRAHLLPKVSRGLRPMPNGIAIQRANLYAYRTPHYQLSNVQRHHPGSFGAQQQLQTLNFGENAVVFTAHPARHEDEKTVKGYPGYWAGFGRAPHAVQHKNVLLMLYQIPKRPGFLELYAVPQFTHTYLPQAFLDEVILRGSIAFARHQDAFLALIGCRRLAYKPFSKHSALAFKNGLEHHAQTQFDLIQEGNDQFWIYELSDAGRESFADFQKRIQANKVRYNPAQGLRYESAGVQYVTSFGGDFYVNGEQQPLEYPRFDCEFCKAPRDTHHYTVQFVGHSLTIDENTLQRDFD